MSKKSFRPADGAQPRYPQLSEVGERKLVTWGIAVVGAAVIGLGACKAKQPPPRPLGGAVAVERLPVAAPAKPSDAGAADASASTPKATDADAAPTTTKPGAHAKKPTASPARPPRPRVNGGMTRPRFD
jgi:hypothetical protein